jgi:hypothetical protein
MLKRIGAMLMIALATAVLAAGCGDDDDSNASGGSETSIETSSLSKDQFLTQGNQICKDEREDLTTKIAAYQEKNPPGKKSPNVAMAEGVKAVILPVLEKEIDQIRELGAPEGDEDEVTEILAAQEAGIDKVAAMKEIEPVEDAWERHFDPANKLMVAYGLKDCPVR